MANTFDEAFQRSYNGTITTLAQAKGNKFLGCTREEMQAGESETYETLAAMIAQSDDRTVTDSPEHWILHGKRTCVQEDFIANPMIAKFDAKKTPVSFNSQYVKATIKALHAKRDIKTISGMLGNALGGKAATTVIPFPLATNTVGVQVGGAGANTGMNMDKLRAVLGGFLSDGFDVEDEISVAISGQQLTDLMNSVTATSEDFQPVQALYTGKVNQLLGMKIIVSQHLPYLLTAGGPNLDWDTTTDKPIDVDATKIRGCVAFVKEAVCVGVNPDIETVVSIRADKKNATQFMSTLGVGCVRLDDKGVRMIACQEV